MFKVKKAADKIASIDDGVFAAKRVKCPHKKKNSI